MKSLAQDIIPRNSKSRQSGCRAYTLNCCLILPSLRSDPSGDGCSDLSEKGSPMQGNLPTPGFSRMGTCAGFSVLLFLLAILGVKPRALHTSGKCWTTELHPQPHLPSSFKDQCWNRGLSQKRKELGTPCRGHSMNQRHRSDRGDSI